MSVFDQITKQSTDIFHRLLCFKLVIFKYMNLNFIIQDVTEIWRSSCHLRDFKMMYRFYLQGGCLPFSFRTFTAHLTYIFNYFPKF